MNAVLFAPVSPSKLARILSAVPSRQLLAATVMVVLAIVASSPASKSSLTCRHMAVPHSQGLVEPLHWGVHWSLRHTTVAWAPATHLGKDAGQDKVGHCGCLLVRQCTSQRTEVLGQREEERKGVLGRDVHCGNSTAAMRHLYTTRKPKS